MNLPNQPDQTESTPICFKFFYTKKIKNTWIFFCAQRNLDQYHSVKHAIDVVLKLHSTPKHHSCKMNNSRDLSFINVTYKLVFFGKKTSLIFFLLGQVLIGSWMDQLSWYEFWLD